MESDTLNRFVCILESFLCINFCFLLSVSLWMDSPNQGHRSMYMWANGLKPWEKIHIILSMHFILLSYNINTFLLTSSKQHRKTLRMSSAFTQGCFSCPKAWCIVFSLHVCSGIFSFFLWVSLWMNWWNTARSSGVHRVVTPTHHGPVVTYSALLGAKTCVKVLSWLAKHTKLNMPSKLKCLLVCQKSTSFYPLGVLCQSIIIVYWDKNWINETLVHVFTVYSHIYTFDIWEILNLFWNIE